MGMHVRISWKWSLADIWSDLSPGSPPQSAEEPLALQHPVAGGR